MPDINIEVSPGTSKLLLTAGKMCNDDIVISAPAGKASGPAPVVKADPNAFTFELDPGASKRLLTAGKYCDRNILVTASGEKPAVTLDIADGSIVITDTGYAQGAGAEIPWGDNAAHEITVTGTSDGANNIVLKGGNPVITLQNVSMAVTAADTPGILLYGGTGAGLSRAVKADLVLVGENSIMCSDCTGIQININATLTIQGNGKLDVDASSNNTPAIGCGDANTYAYTSATGDAGRNNAYRNSGNLIVKSGTVNATGKGRGTNQFVAAIGDSYYANFGDITIEGGTVKLVNEDSVGCGMSGDPITIKGGLIIDTTGGSKGGIHAQESFTMSSGTVRSSSVLRLGTPDSVEITGGNVGTLYTGDVPGRTRTKLSFVTAGGSPIADTEIFVAEGDNEWSALTDEDGVVYTYLAADTTMIRAGLSYDQKKDVTISGGEGTFIE